MLAPRARVALSLLAGSILAACGGGSEPTGTETTPSTLGVVTGNGQSGLIGQTLPTPLVVKVSSTSGSGVRGVQVTFAVTAGSATVSPTTATTDSSGQAQTQVTFGQVVGVHVKEEFLDADGYFDTAKAQPVARLGGIQYAVSAMPFELPRQFTRAREASY